MQGKGKVFYDEGGESEEECEEEEEEDDEHDQVMVSKLWRKTLFVLSR